MRHVAAYLLCVLGGKEAPTAADVEKVITACGGEVNSEKITALLKNVEGKNMAELIDAGKEKLSTVSIGGGGGGASGAAAAGAAGAGAADEAKKEESEEEEADLGGGMDMFGGGDDY